MTKNLITIFESLPGKIEAKSALNPEQTGRLLIQLGIDFLNQSAIAKYEEKKQMEGNIINPHTLKVIAKPGR